VPVELYISDRNQELLIEVADQGSGVDDDLKPRLFEQGVTSKPSGDHDTTGAEHGIGLYLVAGYVRQAGGSIEISDNTPQGTIFSVFIPYAILSSKISICVSWVSPPRWNRRARCCACMSHG